MHCVGNVKSHQDNLGMNSKGMNSLNVRDLFRIEKFRFEFIVR